MDMVLVSGIAAFATIVVTMSSLIQMELRERRRVAHRHGAGVTYAHSFANPHRAPHRRPSRGQARRPTPAAPPAASNPWAPFVVRPDTTPDDLKQQYRALAYRYHPDHGGDPRAMARINALYRELLQRRSRPLA